MHWGQMKQEQCLQSFHPSKIASEAICLALWPTHQIATLLGSKVKLPTLQEDVRNFSVKFLPHFRTELDQRSGTIGYPLRGSLDEAKALEG